jgi:hypothetical protein
MPRLQLYVNMSNEMKTASKSAFHWECQPAAAAIVQQLVDDFCERSPAALRLKEKLLRETGTRLVDWVDHVALCRDEIDRAALADAGFNFSDDDGIPIAEHAGGMFPTLRLDATRFGLGVKVEAVADYLNTNGLKDTAVDGKPWSHLRMARIAQENDTELWIVERHGYRGFAPKDLSAEEVATVLRHEEAFRCRRRRFQSEADAFDHAMKLSAAAKADLGVDRACDLFFAAERGYWMSRNRAGRLQRARQDMLGLGWANHDHHTFRSSREHFQRLIALLESLGMRCRERFYAGVEAGWGAQVMEQPACQIMVFADVDLSPEEVVGDFAHGQLPPRDHLGTVGLWCALHGEAALQAGMHHLEAQFDFDGARAQLEREGVKSMDPFTNFPYLRQSFTQGEIWPVEPKRIAAALAAGYVTQREADQFATRGAIGSHLEILERNEGYKGFNQTGISQIILRTDPRAQAQVSA